MSAKRIDAKALLAHNKRVDTWWENFDTHDVTLDNLKILAELGDAVIGLEAERTIDGAPTVKLEVFDPERKLLVDTLPRSDEALLDIGGYKFALAQVSKAEWGKVSLTFEDAAAAFSRRYTKFRKASRGKVTRAQFIFQLLNEIAETTVPVFSPDLTVRQTVKTGNRAKSVQRGISKSESRKLKVKSIPMDEDQRRTCEEVLDECVKIRATERGMIAAIACIIDENVARNSPGGDPGTGSKWAFQQRPETGWRGDLRKISVQVRNFFINAPTTPFNKVLKSHPGKSIGWQIDQTQRSYSFGTAGQGDHYDKWVPEARKIVAAYGGGSVGSTPTGKYEFSRGEPKKREDTWTASRRLADEVAWLFFCDCNVFYYVDQLELLEAEPAAVISEETKGVSISWDTDYGKPVSTAEVTADSLNWSLAPGAAAIVEGEGIADGTYIIKSMRRVRGVPGQTLSLVRPAPPKTEPAGEKQVKSSGGDPGATSSDWVHPLASPPAPSGKFGENRGSHIHAGVDYPIPTGTSIRAARDGKVVHAGSEGGYGNSIVVRHSSKHSTRYAHLSSFKVRVGQQVKAGETIGKSGNTGNSTGPHLHFELLENGKAVCPSGTIPKVPRSACAGR